MARQPSRVQVRDLRGPEPLRPTPIQSDTFTGAPSRSGVGQNYQALAQSLGSFSSSLRQLSATNAATDKEKDLSLQNQFQKLSQKDRAQVARTGVLPDGTRIAESPALMKAGGIADAAILSRKMRREMAQGYDWTTGDVDAYITEQQNAYLEESGITDPNAVNGFLGGFEKTRAWAREQQEKYRNGRREDLKTDATYTLMEDTVYDLIESDASPADIHKALRASYAQLGKHGTLENNYEQLDRFTVAIAGRIASEHPEVALELVNGKRQGAGPASDPLSKKVSLKPMIQGVVQSANKELVRRESIAQENQVYAENFDRVFNQHDYSRFEDVTITGQNGKPKTLTAKAQKDVFIDNILARGEELRRQDKYSKSSILGREVEVLRTMGIKHPYFSEEIDGLEQRIGPDVVTDPNKLEDIAQRVRIYRNAIRQSETYVRGHLTADTQDFLDTVDVFMTTPVNKGGTPDDLTAAIIKADRAMNPTSGQKESFKYLSDDIHAVIRDKFDQNLFTNSVNQPAFNYGAVEGEVQALAETLYAGGNVTRDEAIEMAAARVAERTPTYKGKVMVGLGSYPMPENWEDAMSSLIEDDRPTLSAQYADVDVWPETLNGGRTIVLTDIDGNILRNQEGAAIAYDHADIADRARSLLEEADNEAIRDAVNDGQRGRRRTR